MEKPIQKFRLEDKIINTCVRRLKISIGNRMGPSKIKDFCFQTSESTRDIDP